MIHVSKEKENTKHVTAPCDSRNFRYAYLTAAGDLLVSYFN